MDWIDSSFPWIKEIKENILPEKDADKKTVAVSDHKQENHGEEEAPPSEWDIHMEAIQVPGVWKQDPNEIRWADLESKKMNSAVIKMKCILK